ncbi:MAG: preprotein translocase subunit SecG [Lactobacillus sp.]|uniref:Protein-export membrane protein SecG n=1 Tax=Bombilactobacillus bombi TaxID=1303590 RepID=A0A347SRV5_9LACO|nr:preprotein translocase subunit SecG [Bombilactobacillus bombi]MCO6542010.1 preprotein translocase subunit SecG [Lactobacillus sp.]AXX64764.1 preprotein translocase subunit SecG [Bombilactobacillus bombi]MCO6542664.1 preprotein translocase subunit SecG [Lactobacillus sp.]RHW47329.1 preprotein translocase subunit SecG [Bombilactobacillus bombi]RHW50090.1 preprotein translocase subunit SecG [Bombilactobacillus bombi]
MYNLIMNILIIDSILIVIAVMMQPQKQQDALNALSGGAGDLFNTQKKRGFEAFMEKVTTVLAIIFFVCALALAFLSSK